MSVKMEFIRRQRAQIKEEDARSKKMLDIPSKRDQRILIPRFGNKETMRDFPYYFPGLIEWIETEKEEAGKVTEDDVLW